MLQILTANLGIADNRIDATLYTRKAIQSEECPYKFRTNEKGMGKIFTVLLKWLANPFNLTSQRHNSSDYNVQCDTPMFHPFTGNVISPFLILNPTAPRL